MRRFYVECDEDQTKNFDWCRRMEKTHGEFQLLAYVHIDEIYRSYCMVRLIKNGEEILSVVFPYACSCGLTVVLAKLMLNDAWFIPMVKAILQEINPLEVI